MFKFFTQLALVFSLGNTYAIDLDVNETSVNYNPKEKRSFFKRNNFSGDFGIQTNGLVQNVGEVPGNKYYGEMEFRYQYKSEKNNYIGLEFDSRINDEDVFEYSLSEAVVEFNFSRSRLALGRTNLEWSYTDNVWGLGKINNRKNFDYFEPGREGLVGFFYDHKFLNGLDISLFASGVYIPEMSQGLIVDKERGTIQCRSAWCSAPSASAEVEGRRVPIYYNVKYPDASDVVFRHSVGFRLGFALDEKFYMSFYQLHKPENSTSVTAEVSVEPDLSVINAEVTPQFYYHDVRGTNVEYRFNNHIKLYASGISTIPNNTPDSDEPLIKYTGIKPKKKKETYLSSGIFYKNLDWSAHAGYIARISEFDTESDILVDYPRWNQAINIGIKKKFTRKIQVALDLKYDMLTEDRLTMFKTDYFISPSIVAALGVNVIGTNKSKESFWSKYENNDSLYSSLKYIF